MCPLEINVAWTIFNIFESLSSKPIILFMFLYTKKDYYIKLLLACVGFVVYLVP